MRRVKGNQQPFFENILKLNCRLNAAPVVTSVGHERKSVQNDQGNFRDSGKKSLVRSKDKSTKSTGVHLKRTQLCVKYTSVKKKWGTESLSPRFQTGLIGHLVQQLSDLVFIGPSDQIKSHTTEQNVKQLGQDLYGAAAWLRSRPFCPLPYRHLGVGFLHLLKYGLETTDCGSSKIPRSCRLRSKTVLPEPFSMLFCFFF